MTTRDDLRIVLIEALSGAVDRLQENLGPPLPKRPPTESEARVDGKASGPRTQDAVAVTVVEAARRLGIGRTAVYQLLNDGRLRSIRIGTRRLIPVAALHELVAWAEEQS